ncbi:hypothetical protein [Pantoea septica]|uniref:hypothetical protein n=1 Tax=Pantoea septica TaxID=472695 RepID=UPI00289FE285|nr:hypothetical protein [Pantoea septica]
MNSHSNGDGQLQPIDLLKSELKELKKEESDLFSALANDNFDDYDERRLNEIHNEMSDLEREIKKSFPDSPKTALRGGFFTPKFRSSH